MTIQPIVEGHGEVRAVPVLLRRLRDLAQVHPLEVNQPVRGHRSEFFEAEKVERMVLLARKQACDGILLMVDGDGDGDCPGTQGPQILAWAVGPAAGTPCAVVMAYREYEAWFLASIESLRGKRGIRADAQSHPEPERPKGAKGQLEERMDAGRSYSETADQNVLSEIFDMAPAYRKCRSFRHLVTAFTGLVRAGGLTLGVEFPPVAWRAD